MRGDGRWVVVQGVFYKLMGLLTWYGKQWMEVKC